MDTNYEEQGACEWDEIKSIGTDFVRIRSGNKWGVMDLKGKVCVETRYQEIRQLRDSVAVTVYRGKMGAVDLQNKTIVPPIYEQLFWYGDHFYARGQTFEGKLGVNGKPLSP